MKRRDVFTTNLIAVIVTLLGLLISNQGALQLAPEILPWIYWMLAICGAIFTFIYLVDISNAIRTERRRLQRLERRTKALPTFVVLTYRRDHFTFFADGSARLQWIFDIDGSEADTQTTEILFPILAEIHEGDQDGKPADNTVKIEKFSINGLEVANPQRFYAPREHRKRIGTPEDGIGGLLELGILKVPVQFEEGKTRHRVVLELLLTEAFANLLEVEHVYIDVPIVTESLEVVLDSPDGRISHLWDKEKTLVAALGVVDMTDPDETHRQRHRWREGEDGKLVWSTESPKLGYRYRIRFQLDGADRKPPA
jgi:hypothetical protein